MPSRLIDIGLVATVLIISTLMATTAHANMVFRNLTGQTVHFDITCNDGVIDGWNIAPHGWRSIFCNNGSQVARVRIRTNRGDFERVVRTTVFDGQVYVLDYDRCGAVNIWRS